jgi:hypothetical protein
VVAHQTEGIAGVVKEEEAGGWVKDIFYWEACGMGLMACLKQAV